MKHLLTKLFLLFLFIPFFAHSQQVRELSLEECIAIAVENNLTVRSSEFNLQSAHVNLSQAQAQRLPSINLSGSYGTNWGRSIDPTTNQFISQQITSNGVAGSASLPIVSGLQLSNSIKQSRIDVKASEADLQKARNDVSLSIATIYLNVIFNQELVENARFQLESSRQQLDRTAKLVASGALPISNELQLQSQVATNEVTLVSAENSLDLALLDLKQAMLLSPGEEVAIVVPELSIDQALVEDDNVEDIYREALTTQPEIESADLSVESAKIGVSVSRGSMYPSLSLNGAFSTNYSNAVTELFVPDGTFTETDVLTETLLETDEDNPVPIVQREILVNGTFEDYGVWDQYENNLSKSLSFGLSVPILNGLSARSNLQRSKISLQQSEINATQQRNTLYQTIETSYRNAVAAAKTFDASQKQVASLEETFRSVENQYNNGAANFTDYQVALNNLFQAKTDLSRAKYDFVFRQKILEFYQGKPLSF